MRPNVWWKISFDKFWPKHGQIWPKYWPNLVIIIIPKSLSGFYSFWLTESQLWAEKVNAVKNNQNNSVFFQAFLKFISYNIVQQNPQVRGLSGESYGHVLHCKPSGTSGHKPVPLGNFRRTVTQLSQEEENCHSSD